MVIPNSNLDNQGYLHFHI